MQALLHAAEARGHGVLGEVRACTASLVRAERALEAARPGDDVPHWARFFDEAQLADEFGHCHRDLQQYRAAAQHAERSLQLRGAGVRPQPAVLPGGAGLGAAGARRARPGVRAGRGGGAAGGGDAVGAGAWSTYGTSSGGWSRTGTRRRSAATATRSPRWGEGARAGPPAGLPAGRRPPFSPAGGPVDVLAEQVGVAVVPGVLLDQVDEQPAQIGEFTVGAEEGVVEGPPGGGGAGRCDLLVVDLEIALGALRGAVVEVPLQVVLGEEDVRQILLTGEVVPEPPAFDAGEVPGQAQQGHRGAADAAHHELLAGQAAALVEKGHPASLERALQGCSLVRHGHVRRALHFGTRPRHEHTLGRTADSVSPQ